MKHERIEINPDIMGGKPVIRGTRVPVCADRSLAGTGRAVPAGMPLRSSYHSEKGA